VLWYLVISRCGQALAAWVAWKAFSQSLLLSMERQTVTYDQYAAITFQPTTARSLYVYIKEIGARRS